MKLSILSLLCMAFFFVSATTVEPKVAEVVLRRRADMPATTTNHGQHGSTATSNTTTAATTMTTTTKSKGNPVIWASPDILQDGTLFYIAISISTLLWCTGKAVNMSLDQQERRAEFLSQR